MNFEIREKLPPPPVKNDYERYKTSEGFLAIHQPTGAVFQADSSGNYQTKPLDPAKAAQHKAAVETWGHSLAGQAPLKADSEGLYARGKLNNGQEIALHKDKEWAYASAEKPDGSMGWGKAIKVADTPWLKDLAEKTPTESRQAQESAAKGFKPLDTTEEVTHSGPLRLGPLSSGGITTTHRKVDDSPEAIDARLKDGGLDINNPMTQLKLREEIIKQLSPEEQSKVRMADIATATQAAIAGKNVAEAIKDDKTLAEILKEKNKALDVLDKITIDDPMLAAATARMMAEKLPPEASAQKNNLNTIAAAVYEQASTRIQDRSIREYDNRLAEAAKIQTKIQQKINSSVALTRQERAFITDYKSLQRFNTNFSHSLESSARVHNLLHEFKRR